MSTLLRALVLALVTTLGAAPAHANLVIEQGGTWRIQVIARVTACLAGHCASDKDRDELTTFIPSGTELRVEIQAWSCNLDLGSFGEFVVKKRKMKLRNVDLAAIEEELQDCSPYPDLKLRKVVGLEKVGRTADKFKQAGKLAFKIKESGRRIGVRVAFIVKGERLDAIGADAGGGAVGLPTSELLDGVIRRVLGR